jgi:hypothetical protein
MGLFLQTLQLAAAATSDNGQLASYTEAPFLLTIEFIGYDDAGNVVVVDDTLNRHIPFTFSNIELDIAASGSRYKVTALPHNEDALKDSVAKLKEDVSISGLTVQEMLQTGKNSLQYRLNSQKKEIAKQGSETGKEEYLADIESKYEPMPNDSSGYKSYLSERHKSENTETKGTKEQYDYMLKLKDVISINKGVSAIEEEMRNNVRYWLVQDKTDVINFDDFGKAGYVKYIEKAGRSVKELSLRGFRPKSDTDVIDDAMEEIKGIMKKYKIQ